jgi:putative DNA primase/helicase
MDRAIILELRRKLPHEQVDRLRYAEPGLFDTLAGKLARFAMDYSDRIRQARPHLPPSLNDRAQDNWEPLLAIAMVAGPEWVETATKTALKISGSESDSQSIGVELLADIREIFEEKRVDRISTAGLIKALCEDEEKPWATYNRGLPIKPRQLAARLKGYGITSKTIRINFMETPKGYEKKQFDEAFSRYIPSPPSVSATTPQISNYQGSGVEDMPTRGGSVADRNNHRIPETEGCGVVADRKPPSGDSTRIEVII